jgi:DNA polymerase-3 subunit epsilon
MIQNITSNKESYFIIESGRQKGEKSILLVEDGSLVGYGYVPFHSQFMPVEKWRHLIDKVIEAEDIDTLLTQYIRSNPTLNIVKY